MICILCNKATGDTYHYHYDCLLFFKNEIYRLFGFHPDTSPDFIYNEILRLRQIARESKP